MNNQPEVKTPACLPQIGPVEWCLGCNSFQFFSSGSIGLCNLCDSHPPQGDFHDEEVTDEELNNYQTVKLGIINPDLPWWGQCNPLPTKGTN